MGTPVLTESDLSRMDRYVDAVRQGRGPLTSAIGILGWSHNKYRTMMADPEFRDFMELATEMRYESVVESLYRAATHPKRPSVVAQQVILYSQHADRGWRPPTQRVAMSSESKISIEHRDSRVASVLALVEKLGVAALQPGGDLDKALEAGDVIDAEAVEDVA